MSTASPIALINAVLFVVIWTVILWAGADHPPPVGFLALIPLVLLAAGLVYWRVPTYLEWMATRQDGRLLRVAAEGVVAGALFAALGIGGSVLLGGGEPGIERTAPAIGLWFVALTAVGAANALVIYGINAVVRGSG
jgi:hypothetical protein